VLKVTPSRLENGTSDGRMGLITFPQNVNNGYIQGFFPAYNVKSGDRFRSIVNCELNATSCYVVFRLDYQTGTSSIQTLWAFVERYEGHSIKWTSTSVRWSAGCEIHSHSSFHRLSGW